MPTSTFDEFLRTLPEGTPIEVEALGYGVRQVVGAYGGRAQDDPGAIVIHHQAREVLDVRRVEALGCPVTGPDAAAERLDRSVPWHSQVVLTTAGGAAVSGSFEGIGEETRPQVRLGRHGEPATVSLDEITAIVVERQAGHPA